VKYNAQGETGKYRKKYGTQGEVWFLISDVYGNTLTRICFPATQTCFGDSLKCKPINTRISTVTLSNSQNIVNLCWFYFFEGTADSSKANMNRRMI